MARKRSLEKTFAFYITVLYAHHPFSRTGCRRWNWLDWLGLYDMIKALLGTKCTAFFVWIFWYNRFSGRALGDAEGV
jgi:hypothetical protein